MNTYTRKQVAKITGIPERRVLFYTEQPFLIKGIEKKTGRGVARLYGEEQILCLLVIKELSYWGMALDRIERITGYLFNWPEIGKEMGINFADNYPSKVKLWRDGKFTEKEVVMSIIPDDDNPEQLEINLYEEEFDGKREAESSAAMILNLSKIYSKAKF